MKWFVAENTHLPNHLAGWGNGYVLIPKGHPLHGVHYEDIDVDVHGGLTFSENVSEECAEWFKKRGVDFISKDDIGSWCVGFDTAHYGDNRINWKRKAVELETRRLLEQLSIWSPNETK